MVDAKITYARWPYDTICVGTNCDKRFMRGNKIGGHIEISLCDDCYQKLKANPKTARQRMEAECNEVVKICFDRLQRRKAAASI